MRRSQSDIDLREVFPRAWPNAIESHLSKIKLELLRTDKRHVGSLVGAGAAGVLGVLMFAGLGAIGGAVIGFAVGHVVGRKLKKKKKILANLPMDKEYVLRLACLNVFLKEMSQKKVRLPEFNPILEQIISEFRPALILQIHDQTIAKEISTLAGILKKNYVHFALIMNVKELTYYIEKETNLNLCAHRLRRIYIPAMYILNEDKHLEFVLMLKRLLELPVTVNLLQSVPVEDSKLISCVINEPSLAVNNSTYQSCRTIADLETFLNCKNFQHDLLQNNKRQATLLFRRRMSETDLKHNFQEKKSLQVLSILANTPSPFAQIEEDKEKLQFLSPFPPASSLSTSRIKELSMDLNQFGAVSLPPNELWIEGDSGMISESSDFSDQEYSEVPTVLPHENDFQRLLEIENQGVPKELWKNTVSKPDSMVYQQKSGDSPICMIKAFCKISYPAEIVFKAIWDPEMRSKWDKVCRDFRIIEVTDEHEILYYSIKTPLGVSRRDWVQRRVFVRDFPEDGNIMMHFVSTEHPSMPPKHNFVRAETLISGYIIRPAGPNDCTMTIITQNDIKGLVPTFIVNKVASKAPADWVKNMKKGAQMAWELENRI